MAPRVKPCPACKCLRQKCTNDCMFAPYFAPDQPEKFANVHKVFGSSTVAQQLKDLPPSQCENTVNSLADEAESCLGDRSPRRDSVRGCVDLAAILHQSLQQVQTNIITIRKDLATYEPQIQSQPQQQIFEAAVQQQILRAYELAEIEQRELLRLHELLMEPKPMSFNDGFDPAAADGSSQHHEHQSIDAQQLLAAVAAREQQQQQKLVGFNSGFDPAAAGNSVTAQTNIAGDGGVMSPSLAPGTFENPYQIQSPQQVVEHHGHPLQTQLQQLHQQNQQTQQAQSESDEKRKGKGVGH
ncbi:LOB domain-containing protein 36-like [Corylus avellana]|uniref:LOB domain-containing protein 36-like n=1 Tax=Corylus avellana TaxID=13451 RepID=UPI001E1F20E3|nr:LOB domain-containing protein 36-like [Corylus avellana]